MIKLDSHPIPVEQWSASDEPSGTIWERRVVEHFTRRLPPGASVLVLGAGQGEVASTIEKFRPDLRWEGVDLAGSTITFDLDVLPWPFRDRQFDAVIAGDILEYLQDPKSALAECVRIASRQVAATFALAPEVAGRPGTWLFEPSDPWKLMAGTDLKLHHLKEGKLLLAFGGIK